MPHNFGWCQDVFNFIISKVRIIQLMEKIMTVERGILLVVGALVLATVLLAVYVNINWLWVTGILGVHLMQASFTGFCPVVMTLKKLGLPQRPGFS